jgi:hypothetical protein
VFYWDLDSDDPKPLILAHPDGMGKTLGTHCAVVKIEFLVERGDPLSGFIIAFVGCDCKSLIYVVFLKSL